MSSVDEGIEEPFKLNIKSLQGRWMCEELGAALKVSGNMVQYASGECYPIEETAEGKLEIFGYRGLENKSDASTVVWKHKESGQFLTWMYEGDLEDLEPDVDTNLIIQSTEGRTSRKRKVDYVALDKELASEEAGKQGVWQAKYDELTSSSAPSRTNEQDTSLAFLRLKKHFHDWVESTDSEKCRTILSKRGYLSTELEFGKGQADSIAASRFISYVKSIGARGMLSQGGNKIHVRVPDTAWKALLASSKSEAPSTNKQVLSRVELIKEDIAAFCGKESPGDSDKQTIELRLSELEKLPIDLEILKETKIGIEINKLSKTMERAKHTLGVLKNIYLDSKKIS